MMENQTQSQPAKLAVHKAEPKDFFLHLFTMGLMYYSVGSFINLAFNIIERIFPDIANNYYSGNSGLSVAMRVSIASLIVIFPLYLYLNHYLHKTYEKYPEKKQLRIRKWLTYFTLFVSAIALAGDLVTVIYIFLGGDITTRFILKAVTVLVTAGAVFYYYLTDTKKEEAVISDSKIMKYFGYFVVAVVLAVVAYSLYIVGSPNSARLQNLDARRVNDLQMTQNNLIYYWQAKQKLPAVLEDLVDPTRGVYVAVDPENSAPYGYNIKGSLEFSLCANFSKESGDLSGSYISPKALPPVPV
ncbi:MAG: DUF5671 domain-containing protein, partial [Candidatus Liptonbacteria bacterium]|nr:DUF5671 domain-containing protein [Candidatus Liptonbacteria bacterium]